MSAPSLLAELGLPFEPNLFAQWDDIQNTYNEDDLFFLTEAFLDKTLPLFSLSAPVNAAMQKQAAYYRKHTAWQRLAYYLAKMSFPQNSTPKAHPKAWPTPSEQTGLFYALVLLAGVPAMQKLHQEKNIAQDIVADTLSDLQLWIAHHKETQGVFGLNAHGWIANHIYGKLYKLGRLQYETNSFPFPFSAYLNEAARQVMVVASGGCAINHKGRFAQNKETAFETLWEETPQTLKAHKADPALGIVLAEPVTLDLSNWKPLLKPGDPTLGVHIPATGPMDHEACGKSFVQAARFFESHFPEHPYQAFWCSSWLLDAQMGAYLNPQSNIVKFFEDYYLFPLPKADDEQHFERIYGGPVDLARHEPQSSLQKAVAAHYEKGERFFMGGGLVFPQILNWGSGQYA